MFFKVYCNQRITIHTNKHTERGIERIGLGESLGRTGQSLCWIKVARSKYDKCDRNICLDVPELKEGSFIEAPGHLSLMKGEGWPSRLLRGAIETRGKVSARHREI